MPRVNVTSCAVHARKAFALLALLSSCCFLLVRSQETDLLYERYKLEEPVPSLNLVALNYFLARNPRAKASNSAWSTRLRIDRPFAPC